MNIFSAEFWSNSNNIIGTITGAALFIYTVITFLPKNYSKWKTKYSEELMNNFCCFVPPHRTPATQGGQVHGGMLVRVLGEHEHTYFTAELFYGESELTLGDQLNMHFVGSHRLNIKMNFWLSRLCHLIYFKVYFGKMYFVPVNSTGFDAYEDKHNLIAEYNIIHDFKKQALSAKLVEQRLIVSSVLPTKFKLLLIDGGYFQPFDNVVFLVFRIHPQITELF
jgi:hypothetical protein